jgi:hypothetical protein
LPTGDYKVVDRVDKTLTGEHQRRFNAQTLDKVAIVMVGNKFGTRDVFQKRNNTLQRIPKAHRYYDALQYLLAGKWLPLSNTANTSIHRQPCDREKGHSNGLLCLPNLSTQDAMT